MEAIAKEYGLCRKRPPYRNTLKIIMLSPNATTDGRTLIGLTKARQNTKR
jgi:hypothetical protein